MYLSLGYASLCIERKRPVVIEYFLQTFLGLCVCPMHCGKMADQIWMRFWMVGRLDPGLGIGPREGVILGANVKHPIVTSGEFVA